MKLLSFVCLAVAAPLMAQSNAIPGTDVSVYELGNPNVYGRIGPAYPNGTAGVVIGHSMANCGSVHVPWDGQVGSQLVDMHIKIAFICARESDGRMVQISGKSNLKHSRVAFNFSGSSPCGPCQSGPSNHFRIGCYDIYSAGFNGNRSYLGPTDEIDPWTGTWEPVGSYFDIGDPGQANYPQPADGVQSLSTSGWDPVKNRMNIPEQELIVPGTFYGQNQVVVIGEPVTNRDNNQVTRQLNFNWSGSSWSVGTVGANHTGSVLERWTGATTSIGGNGSDDGRFLVAVKVTGPVDGMWHYEYAVQNLDNHRGGAALRIPLCADARVENIGFRDIDQNPLNQWTAAHTGGELVFNAAAGNSLDWNTFYNFYFDSDAAPVADGVEIDQARIGPGALTVNVATTVPGLLGTEYLGDGCGATPPSIEANGVPSSPSPGYGISTEVAPDGWFVLGFAGQDAATPVGTGCTVFLDTNQVLALLLFQANAVGSHDYSLPIPAGLSPVDLSVQAFELVPSGPWLGLFENSNGLKVRAAATGCN